MSNAIMVIDDSQTIRTSVEYSIKKLGIPVHHAENGAEALMTIKALSAAGTQVKLCICDVNMPVMDGITFVKEFRKNDRFTPVIMLTTESGQDMVREGKEAGATCWLIKPFKPLDLANLVQKFVNTQE